MKRGAGKAAKPTEPEVSPDQPSDLVTEVQKHGWLAPATTLLVADIVMRGSSILTRRFVEHRLLKNRYGHETATDVMKRQSTPIRASAFALSRIGTGSLPGALLVGGGLIAKTLYDRAGTYRKGKKRKPKG